MVSSDMTEFSDQYAQAAIALTHPPVFEYIATQPEKELAREFALTGDLARSYQLAFPVRCVGLTQSQKRVRAATMMGKPRVDEMYVYYKKAISNRMDIRSDRILAELAAVAFSDIADFLQEDGVTPRNVHQMPEHARRAITSLKAGTNKDGPYVDMKLNDKMKALSLLVNIKNMDQENKSAKAPKVILELPNAN